jgi:hypothetical protein
VQELCAAFIPTADQIEGTGRRGCLEDGTDLESRLVQKIKKQCNNLASHQGVFVATPSGLFLSGGHQTMHDPRQIESAMRQGLEKWKKLATAERLMSREDFAKAQAELAAADRASQYPRDGLVLSVVCRDLPRKVWPTMNYAKGYEKRFNQDYAWFRKGEARTFVPEQPTQGAKHQVPRDLLERLARLHLIDTAWGTTSPFPQKAVERAELTAEVIAVKDHLVSLSYKGRTQAVQEEAKWTGKRYWGPDPKLADRVRQIDEKVKKLSIPEPQTRGIDATIEGHAVYNLKAENFVSFELLVLAQRWGGNEGNGRFQSLDYGPHSLGLFLNLAGDSAAERVPPVFLRAYGWK